MRKPAEKSAPPHFSDPRQCELFEVLQCPRCYSPPDAWTQRGHPGVDECTHCGARWGGPDRQSNSL